MSGSIKLKHASGNGVIISAPSSNPASDRTLTLPSDADGTIVSKDTSNNVEGIASINGGAIGTKNLLINGKMMVAERGTSAISNGYGTVDRWASTYAGLDENPTQEQVDVASGTTPYNLGLRKAFKITNGNQTSGAGTGDYISFYQILEGRDIWSSGWNYTSGSSYITLSFWIKSSVAQSFYGYLDSIAATRHIYPIETGALTANTWTKITKTIPGNSGLTFTNTGSAGFLFLLWPMLGTNYTNNSTSFNQWNAYGAGTARFPDVTTTWFTTNDATLEITGCQLEVGSTASPFIHEPHEVTLRKCQRYFYKHINQPATATKPIMNAAQYNSTAAYGVIHFPTTMRGHPTLSQVTGTDYYRAYGNNSGDSFDNFVFQRSSYNLIELSLPSARGQGNSVFVRTNAAGATLSFDAEL